MKLQNQPSGQNQALAFDIAVLLLANLLTMLFFFRGQHSVLQVLLTYYVQTVLIAVFYYARIKSINLHYIDDVWQGPAALQDRMATYRSSNEQFWYIVLLLAPLALLFYKFVDVFVDGSDAVVTHINYTAVLAGSGLFLLHHIVSYFLDVRAHMADKGDLIHIPYAKLAIRILTIVAVSFVGFTLFASNQDNHLFVVFMLVKTLVDIVLSSSFILLKNGGIHRAVR